MELNIPMLRAQFEPFDVPHLLKLWVILALIIFLFGIIVATSGGYATAKWFWKVHLVVLGSVYVLSGASFLLLHIDPLRPLMGLPPLAFIVQGDLGVNLLNANNIVVILDLHWTAPGTTQANKQLAMPDLDHAPAFWTSVATTFKNNSSVIFDLFNEPFTTSWSCWLNGSSTANASPCTDVAFAVAGMQKLVTTVRATGATNPLLLGGLAYSNDMSQWLQNKPIDPDNSLIAALHVYNFNFSPALD